MIKYAYFDLVGVLRICGCVCVLRVGWTRLIFEETHYFKYSIHIGVDKIYHVLKQHYLVVWYRERHFEFMAKCLNCERV